MVESSIWEFIQETLTAIEQQKKEFAALSNKDLPREEEQE